MTVKRALLVGFACFAAYLLSGCAALTSTGTHIRTDSYSVVSVPEEGGIRFTRITSDEDHFLGSPLHFEAGTGRWRYDMRDRFSVSGDGKKVAFMARRNGVVNIYIRSLEGGRATTKRTFSNCVIDPCLSPDGKWLAFSEYRNGGWNIYETSAEGGSAIRQITNDANTNLYPQYTPDQSEILFTQVFASEYRQKIDTLGNGADVAGGERTVTINHSLLWSHNLDNSQLTQYGEGYAPSFCPGKNRVVVARVNSQTGSTELWLLDLQKGAETILFSQKDRGAMEPAVSPDGRMVAFVGLTEGSDVSANLDIYFMNIDGTNLTQLTFHTGNDMSPRWTSDGKSILIASQRGSMNGEWNIWKMDLPEGLLRHGQPQIPASSPAVAAATQSIPVASATAAPVVPDTSTKAKAADSALAAKAGPAGADSVAHKLPASSEPVRALEVPQASAHADSSESSSAYSALKGMNVAITTSEGKELKGVLVEAKRDLLTIDFFGTPLSLPMAKVKALRVVQ